MATRESLATLGAERSRQLRHRITDELATARRSSGLSLREVARKVGTSPQRIARAERGEPGALTIDLAARIAPVVGLQLAASLHPKGDATRDTAHLRLLARFRARLPASLHWRTEVPIPIAGDPRSGDALIAGDFGEILVEAETHMHDAQLILRRITAKARDLGATRLILLISDTRHNREVRVAHPELREQFPVSARTCLGLLARGLDPGGNSMVVL